MKIVLAAVVAETDPAAARRARRRAGVGELKRLYPSVYTSNLDSPPESIVLRHWQAIVGHLLPGGVISHRSAPFRIPMLDLPNVTRLIVLLLSGSSSASWAETPVSRGDCHGHPSREHSTAVPPPANQYVVKPEQLTNCEVGVKSQWLRNPGLPMRRLASPDLTRELSVQALAAKLLLLSER